jgi:hypothetical protein
MLNAEFSWAKGMAGIDDWNDWKKKWEKKWSAFGVQNEK